MFTEIEALTAFIAQREQAAELRGRTQAAKLVGGLSHKLVRYGDGAIAYHNGEAQVLVSDVLKVHAELSQATNPQKEDV